MTPRVVVVGGGISGLAAAHFLSGTARVTLLEQADRVGGKLRAAELAGVRVDVGAEAMLARRPEGLELAGQVGLADYVQEASTTSAGLWLGGGLRPLPAGTVMGIPADLAAVAQAGVLSDGALAAAADEAATTHPTLNEDVSVGALVRERLGGEVVDRLVDPLLGGVYAATADGLSLRATIPALATQLTEHGSLVDAARAVNAATAGATGPLFVSFPGGLASLAETVGRGRFEIRTRAAVRGLRRTPEGFALEFGPTPQAETVMADAVVVALPAGKAAPLLRDVSPAAAAELAGIEATSVAVISLAYRDAQLPPGSGFLVPASAGRAVKGVTFTSQKWPGYPLGLSLLRASVGRSDQTRVLQRDDADLVALVRHELRGLIGLTEDPLDALVTRWGGGLPRYAVGHVERVGRIRAAVARVPGLAICGAALDGLGVPVCVATARQAANLVVAHLDRAAQSTV
jgi:protoporphyrinogen/coproporphyrinogen III oxidase